MKLDGKVAIITGSARGIGEAIAKKFATEGASVVVNALHAEGANLVAVEIRNAGGQAIVIKADVSNKVEVRNMVEQVLSSFGSIHIMANNAGISRRNSIIELTEEDWDTVHRVDLKGTFLCIQSTLPYMMKENYGKIINISSMQAFGINLPGITAYSSAKGGVISLTKSTARETGPFGINVNCIVPGTILTDLLYTGRTREEVETLLNKARQYSVLGRIGSPQDVANLALFLASDESSFITGQTIRVDGGRGDLM